MNVAEAIAEVLVREGVEFIVGYPVHPLIEACAELERYAEAIEADPARLAALEERLDRLERLRRKYGDDEDAILAFRDRAAAELAAVAGADARLGELEAERADRAKRVERAAAELSRGRRKAAVDMAEAVRAGLARLAMPEACFEVALEPVAAEEGLPCGGSGAEAAELRFSANPGEPPRALRRVASGGELSRVFLALKNVLRRAGAGTALVFDEVDAGVGGGVADRIGAVLAELAGAHQVLCITHLPQIAARADTHFRIAKTTRAGRTHASLERLDESARLDEVARMAGGETISEATRHHARALLDGNTQKSPKRKPTRKPASPRRPSASNRRRTAVPRYIHEKMSANRPVSFSFRFSVPPSVAMAMSAQNANVAEAQAKEAAEMKKRR